MKEKIIAVMGILCFFSPSVFAADGYFSVGGGTGGSAGSYNLTIQGGAKDVEIGYLKFLMGGGIPLIPHGYDNVPSDTYDYPCRHSNYNIIGNEYDGTELGLFAKVGVETIYPGIYLSGLFGFTRVTEIEVSESLTTGQHYEQSSEKKVNWLFGVGAVYFKEMFDDDWRLCFQLDLDNRRGMTGSLGFYW
ncbi:hypothetical protein QUF72_16045 [Desulfobacterales bacterium HSG2]|nr:hypothetical protein [Desulfobacterales bacterium HSG2]